jgi:Cof subfamily protein (haloacid dehalogenase superfamily)
MNFSNIKLVVSDMDGTLLNSQHEVSTRFLKQFQQLKARGIHFVAASGRQFQSITHKLSSIQDDISVIAENGALMQHNGNTQVLLQLSSSDVNTCIALLRQVKGCYPVLCGRKAAYIESKDDAFISEFQNYYSAIQRVSDLTQVKDDNFLKIAVFHFESTEDYVYPHLDPILDQFQVIVSGQHWLDISHKEANKAFALKHIQTDLGISSEETLVFGDYNNDIEMLKRAKFSYAMANAHPKVKATASYTTSSNDAFGVENILELLLSGN